jgi:L-ascorbate metabolism protein UlaG (beta-lactamase superfamily)
MLITILGHAGVLVQTARSVVVVDPVLHDQPLAGGCLAHAFGRTLTAAAMPAPTLIVVTHGHLDHFDPSSLTTFGRETPILLPHDEGLAARVRKLGFHDVHLLRPWEDFAHRDLRLVGTPSASDVDEFGLVIEAEGARFWHVGDSDVAPADAQRIVDAGLRPTVVSVRYQPSQTPFAPFRNLGATFDKGEVIRWLEAVASTGPRLAFPYASAIRYCGHYAWMNRYAFPYGAEEVAEMLRARLASPGTAVTVQPGDVIEAGLGEAVVRPQASPFVRHLPDGDVDTTWEPLDLTSMCGVSRPGEGAELERRVEDFFRAELAPWMASRIARGSATFRKFREYGVLWQLAIHLGRGRRKTYTMDFTRDTLAVDRGGDTRANYFVHVSGGPLLSVLRGEGRADGLAFGDARYFEKIIGMKEGRLWAPPEAGWDLFETLADPFTRYLRHTRAGVA